MKIWNRFINWKKKTYLNLRSKYVKYQDRKRTERANKKRSKGLIPERNLTIVIPPSNHGKKEQ